jgi:hypothetical protein
MDIILRYRSRAVYAEEVAFIRKLISSRPDCGRSALSKEICRSWNWVQPNGQLKDMICRGLLLHLERQGYINLPPIKSIPPSPLLSRKKPEPVDVDKSLLGCNLSDILPISILQVRRSAQEKLFNGLIEQYHYLGYTRPIGEHLKYIAYFKQRPIACLAFSSESQGI